MAKPSAVTRHVTVINYYSKVQALTALYDPKSTAAVH